MIIPILLVFFPKLENGLGFSSIYFIMSLGVTSMKKLLALTLSSLLISSLSSCGGAKNKLELPSSLKVNSLVKLDESQLIKQVNQKNDFVLLVGQTGCLTCSEVISSLIPYIKETSYIFYYCDYSTYQKVATSLSSDKDYALNPLVDSASLLLFDEGKVIKEIKYQASIYQSLTSVKKNLDSYLTSSNYISLNNIEEVPYLDDIKLNIINFSKDDYLEEVTKSPATVLFTLTFCPDCIKLKDEFLNRYLKDNNKKIYYFEVDEIRKESEEKWNSFKTKYQFDSYRNGRVPSIVTYQNQEKVDMVVFINDIIEEKNGEFEVTTSFFKECMGIKNKSKEECKNLSANKQYPLIKEYLDSKL